MRGVVGGVVADGVEVEVPARPDPTGRGGRDPFDAPLQAATNSITTPTNAATRRKRLQSCGHPVDSIVMDSAQLRRDAPVGSETPTRASRADLEARVAELERVVATLTTLQSVRRDDRPTERPDPVALTRALHPRGMRRSRNAKRGSSANGTIAVRAVLFEPPAPR